MTTIPFEQVRQIIRSRSRAERIQIIEDIAETLKQEIITEESTAPEPKKPRVLGLHAHLGKVWMSDDFNDELPDEFWLGKE